MKYQRVLAITADNELHSHFEALSENVHAELDRIIPRPVPSPDDMVARNLELTTAEAGDSVNLPPHYARFKIEPIRFIEENNLPFLPGNVIKYTCRYDAKNGVEDLKKAKRCLELMIGRLEGDPDWWKRKAT